MENRYELIENYGIIGNLNTVALVSNQGSIDYMCLPQFDSPSVFGALLDSEKGGFFCIKPELSEMNFKQLYLTDSAILVTRFFSEDGIAELTDFMSIDAKDHRLTLVRKLKSIRGDINFNLQCQPRFNYAQSQHKASAHSDHRIDFESEDGQKLHLFTEIPLTVSDNDIDHRFLLKQGEMVCFVLQGNIENSSFSDNFHGVCIDCYNNTFNYWKDWINQCRFTGRWIETVRRSCITLKLLTSVKYGSMIAAPTFGIPEKIGGKRNWDYRYTWIRDTSFTMYAFLKLGFMEEASAFMHWLSEHCIPQEMYVMYNIDGQKSPEEKEIPLSGYKNSKPVLIGNDAVNQHQMDIYGELIDTIYLYNKYGGEITHAFWEMLVKQVEYVCENWNKPDYGLWEVRGGKRDFLHSRLMCWVALDRAIKIGDNRSFPFPHQRWLEVRDEIYNHIHDNFWNEKKQAYVQYRDSDEIDASVLLMPLVRFISPKEPRWLKTLAAVERELKLDVLIYRYRNTDINVDGLGSEEGTFTMCSFWYAECLAKSGHIQEANEVFAKLLGYASPLRLYSEQLSNSGQQVGNFPQAFTHLALISAAIEINRLNKKANN
ncbi:glycoside hydrolase family 15 protein [Mucilaginibacter sp. KACC 22063]|uniref:glycoside hydrolase family 15 protein n=1 Tax=Mucilaginibacter sp. KACC 22063 TaxID=3025666 RepID=UPI0023669C48|nr:glycoside hydrolase family 15 protein [Mucilaginibacter sp. KACC 22063]WDF54498.1 glycoside hydrolase family 15 protein [Mucilaginibacter sp. KACC 22063]